MLGHHNHWRQHLMNAYEVEAGMVLFAGKIVWSIPECVEGEVLTKWCDINRLALSVSSAQCVGMIYPEFRSRTPPPTYIASMMEFDDRRRPRRLSCDDVEMFPNVPTSEAVDPVPATPPPAYRGRSMVRGMPVYCPRALRSRPHSFVAIDSADRGTGGSSSTVIVRANLSSNLDVVGKRTQGVGHGVTASHTLKPQSSDDPTVSVSLSVDDCHVASCSADSS